MDYCRDAGAEMPVCNVENKEMAGYPCQAPGQKCTVTYGCTPVLLCAYANCAIPIPL
jgi:hypothetical protein